jgi:hypothetical protein
MEDSSLDTSRWTVHENATLIGCNCASFDRLPLGDHFRIARIGTYRHRAMRLAVEAESKPQLLLRPGNVMSFTTVFDQLGCQVWIIKDRGDVSKQNDFAVLRLTRALCDHRYHIT